MTDKQRELAFRMPGDSTCDPDRWLPPQERISKAYDESHPWIYRELVKLAFDKLYSGRKRYSTKALFEELRYNRATLATEGEQFKICNSHTAYYARKIMREHEELRGFFATRIL